MFKRLFSWVLVALIACGPTLPALASQQTLNVGSALNDGTGDTVRSAFQKSGTMFTEAYSGGPLGQQSPRLLKWRAALAQVKRGTRNAYLETLGDSITRGVGAIGGSGDSSQQNLWNANGYPGQLAAQLALLGIPTSFQSIWGNGGTFGPTTIDSRLNMGASGTSWTLPYAYTLGGQAFSATQTGRLTWSPTVPVDTCDVYTIASGSQTVQLGTGTAVTITGTGNTNQRTRVTAPLGTNVLSDDWVSGTVYVTGIDCYNNTVKSVHVFNGGIGSATSSDISGATNPYSAVGIIKYLPSDLLIIMSSVNDITSAIPAATTTSNIQSLIAAGSISGSVILMSPTPVSTSFASQDTIAAQNALNAVYLALAAANPNVPFLDLYQRWSKDYTVQQGLGWMWDGAHPTQYGYSDIASFLTPLIANP